MCFVQRIEGKTDHKDVNKRVAGKQRWTLTEGLFVIFSDGGCRRRPR